MTQMKARNYEELANVAEIVFKYEGKGEDTEILKLLDKKYDALMDKLMLEALEKQLGQCGAVDFCFWITTCLVTCS